MTERESETILAFKPPPLAMLRLWLAPARAWHRPSFLGVEHVDPSHPTMFVGNHTLYGVQDVPHIQYELLRVHGISRELLRIAPTSRSRCGATS